MYTVLDYLGNEVEPKPKGYEFPALDDRVTEAKIWHVTPGDVGAALAYKDSKTGQLKYLCRILQDTIYSRVIDAQQRWLYFKSDKPLSSTIRFLEYINETDKIKQMMPLHYDFSVMTYPLYELIETLDESPLVLSTCDSYSINEGHRGALHGPTKAGGPSTNEMFYVAGGAGQAHTSYCPAKSRRIAAFLFVYPGEAYKGTPMFQKEGFENPKDEYKLPAEHLAALKEYWGDDPDREYTYGDYYEAIFAKARASTSGPQT